jgi:general nucleoside transport system ATP-binding protein
MTISLDLRRIRKSFNNIAILDDVNFRVAGGEVHALLGENGAGKSSLMNIAAGLYAPEAGAIVICDQSVTLNGPADARARGIGMVHQHFKLITPFSVAENILLPSQFSNYRLGIKNIRAAVREKASEVGFDLNPEQPVGTLSVAQQQQVEIVKVLINGARIIIFDEPTAVLTDAESDQLLSTVRRLAKSGAAVVLITHKLNEVIKYADVVTILRRGKTVATLDPALTTISELTQLTVGEAQSLPLRSQARRTAVRLAVDNLSCARANGGLALQGASLSVRGGEIYGIAGVSGNGQAELAEALMGVLSPLEGEIWIEQQPRAEWSRNSKYRAEKVAIIPADRYTFGLAGRLSLAENFAAAKIGFGAYGPVAFLNRNAMRKGTISAIAEYEIQGASGVDQRAALLSGGNAQKLVIAREFQRDPAIVLAQSPSRGLDARACVAVYQRLLYAREHGAAVLLISEDLDEVISLSDRVGVMTRGRIVAEFERPADRQKVGQAMVGHA